MKPIVALFLILALVNINTAPSDELESLPGIGPVIAERIIQFRERRGGYRRVEELLAVPGISEARWRVLAPLVTVGRSD